MSIYEKPVKSLIADCAKEHLTPGQTFKRSAAVQWFAEHYGKVRPNTVNMHVDGMSVNNLIRRYHPSMKPGSGHDLFYKLGPDQFRLWDPASDPPPRYKEDIEKELSGGDVAAEEEPEDEPAEADGMREFAFERDLRNYLVKNLGLIESGLRLYDDDEGITGVEFPVGGRFIDILAVDKEGRFVVIELKVSRGYDRVVGQLLRYMGWVEQNMEASHPPRGIIVAKEITSDLKLASSRVPDIQLIEYEIAFKLRPI
jgi:hypothetical protein